METKINSETAFFTLNGQEFEVKKVEAKKETETIFVTTNEQAAFIQVLGKTWCTFRFEHSVLFGVWVEKHFLIDAWQNYLINQARIKGFVSGCHFSDGLKLIYMPSGRMKLLTLSKLVTDCRNPTVIYNNGKWLDVIKKEPKPDLIKIRSFIANFTGQINRIELDKSQNYVVIDAEEAKFLRDILNEKLNEKPCSKK